MTTTSKQAFVAGCIGVATFVAVWWTSVSFSLIDHRVLPLRSMAFRCRPPRCTWRG